MEPKVPRPQFGAPDVEQLTGFVQQKTARAGEERLARSFAKSKDWRGIEFRKKIIHPSNVAGSIEIDFWAYNPAWEPRAIQVDNEWVHAQAATAKKDRENWARINNYLLARGLQRLVVIPASHLETQELADRTLREIV
jgi:hypothetical protein